jgi:dUTP pyrophosphatase
MMDKLNDLGSLKDMANKLEEILKENKAGEIDLNTIYDEFGLDVKKLDEDFRNYKPKLYLGYKKLHSDAVTPKYNYGSDSGFDLHSVEDVIISPFGRALVPTGLSFDIKDGYEIQVRSKSGLAINQGLMVLNSPGTVDNGYTGEVKVIVFNTNNHEVTIAKGMKVAQAVLCPVVNGVWVDLDETDNMGKKDRNNNGFGSTKLF